MNNTINRMKKRADILTEYFINKVEGLEKENNRLKELYHQNYPKLRKYELMFERMLDNVDKVRKFEKGEIEVRYKEPKTHNIIAISYFDNSAIYPFVEMLLEKYEQRKEFERLLKKAVKCDFTPITPLTKGE